MIDFLSPSMYKIVFLMTSQKKNNFLTEDKTIMP